MLWKKPRVKFNSCSYFFIRFGSRLEKLLKNLKMSLFLRYLEAISSSKKAFSRQWKKSFKKGKFAKVKLFGIKNFTLFGFFLSFSCQLTFFGEDFWCRISLQPLLCQVFGCLAIKWRYAWCKKSHYVTIYATLAGFVSVCWPTLKCLFGMMADIALVHDLLQILINRILQDLVSSLSTSHPKTNIF